MSHEHSSSPHCALARQNHVSSLVNKLTFADEAAVRAARGVYVLLGPRPTYAARPALPPPRAASVHNPQRLFASCRRPCCSPSRPLACFPHHPPPAALRVASHFTLYAAARCHSALNWARAPLTDDTALDLKEQRTLMAERAAAYQSVPIVSTLVLGFSCNQLDDFAKALDQDRVVAADIAVALLLCAIASSLFSTVVFILEFYYIKRLCGAFEPDLDLYATMDSVSEETYELRKQGRNALWVGLCCLVSSTGVNFVATVEAGPLAAIALVACTASACSVPFIVARFRSVYLPIVSPKRYGQDKPPAPM